MSGPPTPTKQPPVNYRPVTPSPTVSGVSKVNDDDLRRKGTEELVHLVRKMESDYRNLMLEHSNLMKDINRRMQINLLEIRGLKDINQKLQDDNQELRDLCCFLDDDRQRGRKLAREWQRFGRYTASVMRSEVTAYQDKLNELETKQDELMSDNMELKELCLYLDQERLRFTGDRDEGDGSSNTTTASETRMEESQPPHPLTAPEPPEEPPPSRQRTPVNDATAQYIRQLEDKVRQLEEEKRQLAQRVERNGAEGYRPGERKYVGPPHPHPKSPPYSSYPPHSSHQYPTHTHQHNGTAHRHEMVLEVHDQLERHPPDLSDADMNDKERAIVREMCNVVWRKLGDVGPAGDHRPPTRPHSQNYAEMNPHRGGHPPQAPQTGSSSNGPGPSPMGGPSHAPPPLQYRGPTPQPYMDRRSGYFDDRGHR